MKPLSKPPNDQEFNELLLEAIDEALAQLGEKTKASFYFYLETKFALPKKDIPSRVSDFADAIEKLFGQGAVQLEILIMKCLDEKVRATYQWSGPKWLVPDLTFTKYVKLMKIYLEDITEVDLEVLLDAGEQEEQDA